MIATQQYTVSIANTTAIRSSSMASTRTDP
jgi:hypothetical protein